MMPHKVAFYPCCAYDIEEPLSLLTGMVDEIVFVGPQFESSKRRVYLSLLCLVNHLDHGFLHFRSHASKGWGIGQSFNMAAGFSLSSKTASVTGRG
jgi:hypothetical protein